MLVHYEVIRLSISFTGRLQCAFLESASETFFLLLLEDDSSKKKTSCKLGLPISYDRRYRINVALLSKDVTDVTQYSTSGSKRGTVYCNVDEQER